MISSRQWFVQTLEYLKERCSRAAGSSAGIPPFMGARFTSVGRGPEPGLGDQPPAVLRRAVPRLVPARRRRASRATTQPIVPDEAALPIDPQDDVPAGFTTRPARRAGWVRRRPRRHGHVGDVVADAADRGPVGGRSRPVRAGVPDGPPPAGARHHPDLAVLHRAQVPPRARLAPVDATLRSAGSCWTRTARRCRSRRATSSCPRRCSSGTRRTPSGTGRGAPASGIDAAIRRAADEGRTPARDQDPERIAVRARDRAPRRAMSTEPLDLAMLASLARGRPRGDRGVRGYEHARALDVTERFFWGFTDDYLELVKQRAYGVARRRAARERRRSAPRAPSTCSSGCSRRSCRT